MPFAIEIAYDILGLCKAIAYDIWRYKSKKRTVKTWAYSLLAILADTSKR